MKDVHDREFFMEGYWRELDGYGAFNACLIERPSSAFVWE